MICGGILGQIILLTGSNSVFAYGDGISNISLFKVLRKRRRGDVSLSRRNFGSMELDGYSFYRGQWLGVFSKLGGI